MKQTVDLYDFRNAFARTGRKDNFSHMGLGCLFDYIEESEEESGLDYELDVTELCCEYQESTLEEINTAYDQEFEDIEEAAVWLSKQTIVCGRAENDEGEETIVFSEF